MRNNGNSEEDEVNSRQDPKGEKKNFVGVMRNKFDVLDDDIEVTFSDDINEKTNDSPWKTIVSHHSPKQDSKISSIIDSPKSQRNGQSSKKHPGGARSDDAVYEDDCKEYLFEWISDTPRRLDWEHPQHVFQTPAYWR